MSSKELLEAAKLRPGVGSPARSVCSLEGRWSFTWYVGDDDDRFVRVEEPAREGRSYLLVWRNVGFGGAYTVPPVLVLDQLENTLDLLHHGKV